MKKPVATCTDGPITTWKAAAEFLGKCTRTLVDHRSEVGRYFDKPEWADKAALWEWWLEIQRERSRLAELRNGPRVWKPRVYVKPASPKPRAPAGPKYRTAAQQVGGGGED